MELFALLNIEKRKLDDLLVDVEKIIETLKRLLIAKNENGKKDSEKSLIEYKEKLELHINSIWEKAILPHLMFYTHLILGKCKKNSLGWL